MPDHPGGYLTCELCGGRVEADALHDSRACEMKIRNAIRFAEEDSHRTALVHHEEVRRLGCAQKALEVLLARRARAAMGGPAGKRWREVMGDANA